MRQSVLAYIFLARCVFADESETLELLQTHAKVVKFMTNVGDWWPSNCDDTPNLQLKTPRYSNLGGSGPDTDSPEEIAYPEAGVVDGKTVDVIVKAVGAHTTATPAMNGIKPDTALARVNVRAGTKTTLSFSLVDSATKQAVTSKFMAITFFDLDEGRDGNSRTTVTMPAATDLFTHSTTELTLADDCTGATSSTKGVGKDNPTSVDTMNDLQLRRTATFVVGAGSSWSATFDVAGPPMKSGRNIMFAVQPVIPCIIEGGSRCGGARPTTTTTTTTTVPSTCGNVCNAGTAFKKCAFWGDPHYTKTFRGAAPAYADHFNLHGTGVQMLAATKCGSVEIQSVQCPWHGGAAAVSVGFAMRVGASVATVIGNKVRNVGGITIQGGNPWTVLSGDSCASIWIKTNGNGAATPGRSYYMDMELKIDEPGAAGTCVGDRAQRPPAQNDILFTSDELKGLCGQCAFACPAALLLDTTDPDFTGSVDPETQATPTAEQMCEQAGVSYEAADTECLKLSENTVEGGTPFMHEACILDFCASGGDTTIIDDEIETEKHFEADDGLA